jgi:hypothetical protein
MNNELSDLNPAESLECYHSTITSYIKNQTVNYCVSRLSGVTQKIHSHQQSDKAQDSVMQCEFELLEFYLFQGTWFLGLWCFLFLPTFRRKC